MPSSHSPDRLVVGFDDDHGVANAGLLLPATLAARLGMEQLVDRLVDLGDRPGGQRPGRKVLTLVHAMVAGGDGINDADVLRTAQTAQVLGHRVLAPSTCALPTGESLLMQSLVQVFGEEFGRHLGRSCPRPRELPFHKIVDWDATAGRFAYDPTYDQKQPDWT